MAAKTARKKPKTDELSLFETPRAAATQVIEPPAAVARAAEPVRTILKPAANGKARLKTVTAETLAGKQREISVSEFFAKNRHLLGFDNKRKALLTTVKEAVDNSLDACEEAGILPEIFVGVEQTAEERFRVTVRDNGPGIVKAQIPNIFGKLLYGSKFHRLKMSRGQQGIGISAAGMYGLLTTGKPVRIKSRTGPKKEAHYFELQIDTAKNRPEIIKDETIAVEWERGTEVVIELSATYVKGKQSVDEYLEQTAIANAHTRFTYALTLKAGRGEAGEGEEQNTLPIVREFPRGSEDLPAETREIQPHPHGIELGVLMKMLKESGGHNLSAFLQDHFSRVTTRVAHAICDEAKISRTIWPSRLSSEEIERVYQAMQTVRVMAPPTDCLAPIGVRALLAGLLKEVKAEFYTATTRPPAVYRGNPFEIEVALAYGGELGPDPKENEDGQPVEAVVKRGKIVEPSRSVAQARIIRFANRVPLLYQQSACCIFKTVLDLDWRRYGLSQSSGALPQAPLVVMLHMASVWVPFTSESKEAIADYDEIRAEIKLALQECGRKLAAYISRRRRMKYEGERRNVFEKYILEVANACETINSRIDKKKLTANLQAIAQKVTARADQVLDDSGRVVKRTADEEEFGDNVVVVDRSAPLAKAESD